MKLDDLKARLHRGRIGKDGVRRAPEKVKREAATAITDLEALVGELGEALKSVAIGGNHLALLIGTDHPPYTAGHSYALEHYGAGDTYEIWCCWKAIICTRATLAKLEKDRG